MYGNANVNAKDDPYAVRDPVRRSLRGSEQLPAGKHGLRKGVPSGQIRFLPKNSAEIIVFGDVRVNFPAIIL